MTRNVIFFTGTRAEFGLLKKTIKKIQSNEGFLSQVVVSGTHLSEEFGMTLNEIESAKIKNIIKVPIWSGKIEPQKVAADVGIAIGKYAEILTTNPAEIAILLGDRLEAFAFATSAMIMNIPILHIHGGEITSGAMDDSIRHAITKMSSIHVTANEEYRQRVIQMGEHPNRVFNFGSPFLDSLDQIDELNRNEIEQNFSIKFNDFNGLVTFHPALFDEKPSLEVLDEMLGAIEHSIKKFPKLNYIFTGTNNDLNSTDIRKKIQFFISRNNNRAFYVESFGKSAYISTLKICNFTLGNSSSFLLEAPYLGIPTVVIGSRQLGRPIPANSSKPKIESQEIFKAIENVLGSYKPLSENLIENQSSNFSKNIEKLLVDINLGSLKGKVFYDEKLQQN